ncbi:hypothetical protein [Neisseria mucosa]|nr:hypothetical protein [Neisseria mucosa]
MGFAHENMENLIPFAIISANVIRGKAHATVLYKTHAAFRRPFA